mgnify:FL=1
MDTVTVGLARLSRSEFAALGTGETVYIREIDAGIVRQELARALPSDAEVALDPEARFFAVYAADGTRIALADSHHAAVEAARENALLPVSVH